jgi:hypothetical protein
VKTYLDQKYAGYSLLKVDRKRQPGTTTFEGTKVKFIQNGTLVDLDFDANNALVAKPTGPQGGPTPPPAPAGDHAVSYVTRSELPTAVASVISGTYSSYTYGWTELHVHDGVTQYDVKLFSNNQPTTLHLNASGATVTPTPPAGPGAPASGTATAPVSGTATAPVSGTATAPVPPAPPVPTAPGSLTATPPAPANRSFILDGSKLPSAIGSYLQTNFSGYTFLGAEMNTPPTGTTGEYMLDIAVGKQLYKVRFTSTGELLMAEARN